VPITLEIAYFAPGRQNTAPKVASAPG